MPYDIHFLLPLDFILLSFDLFLHQWLNPNPMALNVSMVNPATQSATILIAENLVSYVNLASIAKINAVSSIKDVKKFFGVRLTVSDD